MVANEFLNVVGEEIALLWFNMHVDAKLVSSSTLLFPNTLDKRSSMKTKRFC